MNAAAAARVVGLWRYPVKSMGGGPVDEVRLGPRGVVGDRLWAVRDLEDGRVATARRLPALLTCRARFTNEPPADVGPGRAWPVVVTLPDGAEVGSADPRVHDALTEVLGRPSRLEPLPPLTDRRAHRGGLRTAAAIRRELGLDPDEPLPDPSFLDARTLARLAVWSTPPGTFADVAGLHLLTTTSLATLAAAGVDADVRRFRPTALLEPVGTGREQAYPERAWVDHDLALGDARASVTMPTIRCVVPGHAQADGIAEDRGVSRAVAREAGRFLGVYAEVRDGGSLRVGDEVASLGRTPVPRAARVAGPVVRRVARPALRLGARLLP
ncbi:MOSC N-terminal beta barrel domain-containing protein [Nocardioides sp. AX2bis]|uniref:MOSC N-terminal beta barrel domain-containing protein n=1 Tax=Nocardioides sp. AX2bis TaxID=2653157 RepID=UPI0012F1FF7D|nr:MOSC N-terminal beta barrel domain-containing protein [Nocardioides sp. AX2bis]VXC55857.1 conserved hypothetical protein [Nocardioides sp. AX2bis]